MVTKRSRTLAAPIGDVWKLAVDANHRPRWWPATQRVESVSKAGWTSVFTTPRGRTVRADYSVRTTEPPKLMRWRQDVEGTPFERIFSAVEYELHLDTDGPERTRAELRIDQQPKGWARFGRIQLRLAARRQLDEALAGLEAAVVGTESS